MSDAAAIFYLTGAVITLVAFPVLFAKRYPGQPGRLGLGIATGIAAIFLWPVTIWVAAAMWLTGFMRPRTPEVLSHQERPTALPKKAVIALCVVGALFTIGVIGATAEPVAEAEPATTAPDTTTALATTTPLPVSSTPAAPPVTTVAPAPSQPASAAAQPQPAVPQPAPVVTRPVVPQPEPEPAPEPDPEPSAYYSNCAEARAAGAAPLYAGEPGYRSGLDRDGDGVACEQS